MNWGKGIIIAMVAFVGFIVVLATILMSKNVDLVAEDYYQKEISYEEEINAKKNANALQDQIKLAQDENFLIVSVPEGDFREIKLELKRPNNDKQDLEFEIEGTRTYLIEKAKLNQGMYDAKFTFQHENQPCQVETDIYVNK